MKIRTLFSRSGYAELDYLVINYVDFCLNECYAIQHPAKHEQSPIAPVIPSVAEVSPQV